MTFDPIHVSLGPPYKAALWPLAWISVFVALTLLPPRYRRWRNRGQQVPPSSADRWTLAFHAFLLCMVLICGLFTLLYHLRVTEPQTSAYVVEHPSASSAVRRAADRDYLNDATAFGLALVATALALTVRARRMEVAGGGA